MLGNEYRASVLWQADGGEFAQGRYSRAHVWRFDGVEVPASASPLHVRPPLSQPDAVDPEEAFVAALSSCHMLFFLYFAQQAGFVAARYEDRAVGVIGENARGKHFVERVTLHPDIEFAGDRRPTADEIADLHHRAHDACYIANSVLTEVTVASAPAHS